MLIIIVLIVLLIIVVRILVVKHQDQMEKEMQNEMEVVVYLGVYGDSVI